MASKKDYEIRTEQLLEPIAKDCGVWIYDVEYVKEAGTWYLRAYIEKDGGVTIDDCEAVSRRLSDELDAADYISEEYILEVSSPGLGRTLKKDRHLENSIGMEVEIKLYEPIDGTKEYSGTLDSFDQDTLFVLINDAKVSFERKKIAAVKLALDI